MLQSETTECPISPEYRLIKFLIGLMIVTGMGAAYIGHGIAKELNALASSREQGFIELKQEITEFKSLHLKTVTEWTVWRTQVDAHLREIDRSIYAEKETEK